MMVACWSLVTAVQRFGELLRKLWNPRSFKSHVSPHEMLQVSLPAGAGEVCTCVCAQPLLCVCVCVCVRTSAYALYGVSVSAPLLLAGCIHGQQEEIQDHRTG